MHTRQSEPVMSDKERAEAVERYMRHVQAPWRSDLLDLLKDTPEAEAYNLFSRGFIYEALEEIKKATPGGVVSLKTGGAPLDVDLFLGMLRQGMPSNCLYEADEACFDQS